ncbi:MAG: response regulator [Anaerolineales bacterium]|nr:MAG: response regulator [Anaerolineales bacterium]
MVAWKTESDTVPLHTVLIVCDEPGTIATWEPLLTQRNCIVLSESSVRTALQTARLVAPSLMLVDLQTTKKERTELLNGLRKASTGPILLLVSASTAQLALEANSSSADEYLMKPVNPAVLVIKAMAWLGQGRRVERSQQPLMR